MNSIFHVTEGTEKRVAIYDTFKPGADKFIWIEDTPVIWQGK